MRAVFADTFYWTALTNTEDGAHQYALTLSQSLQAERIITTEEVLDEDWLIFQVRGAACANMLAIWSRRF